MAGLEKKKRPRRCNQGPKRFAAKVKAQEDLDKALQLRKASVSIRDIAKTLDRSIGWVSENTNRAVEEIPLASARAWQQLLVERHEAVITAHWTRRGTRESAAVIQQGLRDLAKVLGIETARKLEVELTTNLQGLLDRVQRQCSPDVYEQVLAVLAGDASASALGASADGPAEEDDRDPGEPG